MNELSRLLEYHRWATERTLEALSALTDAQFTQVIPSSFPSVRDTLVHAFMADRTWLARVQGETVTRPEPEDYPTLTVLRQPWLEVIERWSVVLHGMTDPNAVIAYHSFAGEPFTSTVAEIVRHMVNHGSYHRGQVTTLLRQLGAKTVSTDMIVFTRQNPQ